MSYVGEPEIVNTFEGHDANVRSVCFSPDQRRVCSAGEDGKLILWDLLTTKIYSQMPQITGNLNSIWCADYSKLGVACGCRDRTIRLWDTNSSSSRSFSTLIGHSGDVWTIRFSEDCKKLFSGGNLGQLKIWSVEKKTGISTFLQGEGSYDTVYSVDILNDDKTFVSGHADGWIRLWDCKTGNISNKILGRDNVFSVQFRPGSLEIGSGHGDGSIKIHDLRTLKLLHSYDAHKDYTRCLSFHPSGKFLVSGGWDGYIKLTDLEKKKVVFKFGMTTSNDQDLSDVNSVRFSSNGDYFASGDDDRKLIVWKSGIAWEKNIGRKDEDERTEFLRDNCCFSDGDVFCGEKVSVKFRSELFFIPKVFL